MNRKILFGGTVIVRGRKITNNAILIENDELKNVGSLKNILKIEPVDTFTDLINLNNNTVEIN